MVAPQRVPVIIEEAIEDQLLRLDEISGDSTLYSTVYRTEYSITTAQYYDYLLDMILVSYPVR